MTTRDRLRELVTAMEHAVAEHEHDVADRMVPCDLRETWNELRSLAAAPVDRDGLRAFVEGLAEDSTVAGECVHCLQELALGEPHKPYCVTARARGALAALSAPKQPEDQP